MVWTITILTFLASMLIAGSVLYALTPKDTGVASRLTGLFNATTPVVEEKFATKQKGMLRDTLVSVGKLGSTVRSTSKQELMMMRAGYRSPGLSYARRPHRTVTSCPRSASFAARSLRC